MEEFTDKNVLLKEVKGYEISSDVLQDSEELLDDKLQGGAVRVVEVEHGTKGIDMSVGEEAMRFECRGIGLEEKLAQLSIGKGELLLVRLRRRRQAGEKNQNAVEQHQSNARGSHLGSDCDKDHDEQEKSKRASKETDTGGIKHKDGDGADKDYEWQYPKEKNDAIDFGEQPTDTEKRKKQDLNTKIVKRKIQSQSKKEQLQLYNMRPKQRKEKQMACLRDQLKEKDDYSIVKVKRELQKKKQDLATLETNFEEMETQLSVLQRQLVEKCSHETVLEEQLKTREEEARTMEQQLRSEVEEKDTKMAALQDRLRAEKQQVTELQSQLETNEEEMRTMRQQLNLSHGQLQEKERDITTLQVRLRDEEQQRAELQRHFMENTQEIRMMRAQLTDLRDKEQQLRVETQRSRELRQQITELRETGELLRREQQRVAELQSQLRRNEQEMRTMRQQINEFQGLEAQLRREQQQVTALQSQIRTNEQEMRRMTERRETQHRDYESRPDWAINRNEIIQMKDQELGRGAWGVVVRGKFCGCDVAVKEMHENIYSSYNRDSFNREVDIASKCRHPCLLQFIGATIDEMRPLMVTEIMGCNLRDRLFDTAQSRLTIAEIVVISLDVARALNYLHEKKPPMIHSDISSANVLLWRQGNQWRGKVSDYGTAYVVRESAGTSYQGAASYSAPEALALNHKSCKVDVYSFGVLLCEMCIRQQPNQDQRRMQISWMTNDVLRNLVSRCVEEEPGERPNMQEIIAELENFGRRF